jgi:hypothetical protein
MKWWGGFSFLALASAGVLSVSYVAAPSPASARTQTSVPQDLRRLCEKRTFTRSELRALRQQQDYEQILRYTAEECAGVAALLTGSATATLPAAASAGSASGGSASGGDNNICDRDRFTRREIAAIQSRADFARILEYTLAQCPAVASVLADTATASLPGSSGNGGDGGTGSGGGTGGGGTGGGGTGGGGTGGGGHGGGTGGGGEGHGGGGGEGHSGGEGHGGGGGEGHSGGEGHGGGGEGHSGGEGHGGNDRR